MQIGIFLYYILLVVLLFFGSKPCKKGEWNTDGLSLQQTKAFLGYMAIVIMFHHISQKTCAPYMNLDYYRPGLEPFVFIGYLCVAVFFFCSGFGMYTAAHNKSSFFDKFFIKRMLPVIIPTAIVWFTFFFIEKAKGMTIEPPLWINVYDYIWYIPALLYIYLFFYLGFHFISNEKVSFLILWIGVVSYFVLCHFFSPGTWWYNTQFMFAIGAMVAAKVPAFYACSKKHYFVLIFITPIVTAIGVACSYYTQIVAALGMQYNPVAKYTIEIIGQVISSFTFVWFILLVGMKIRIGNRLLTFFSTFTLELYLVHPLFVQLFGYNFVQPNEPPIYYISNQLIYIPAVIFPAIPIAYGIHYFTGIFRRKII